MPITIIRSSGERKTSDITPLPRLPMRVGWGTDVTLGDSTGAIVDGTIDVVGVTAAVLEKLGGVDCERTVQLTKETSTNTLHKALAQPRYCDDESFLLDKIASRALHLGEVLDTLC